MRISDWSSDVCSSDLVEQLAVFLDDATPLVHARLLTTQGGAHSFVPSTRITEVTSRTMSISCRCSTVARNWASVARCETTTSCASAPRPSRQIGRASCRERVCQYV